MSAFASLPHRLIEAGRYLGIGPDNTTHTEKCVSAVGAALGMLAIYGALQWYASDHALALLMASIAASAVLVFAVPHGALSQPWPVIGGYLVSALMGVTCQRWIPNTAAAIPLAVGGAVLGMYYLRCLHPPGGAVALVAITGGPDIHQLGYYFIVLPALANALVLVGAGVAYNRFFPWRRYPVHMLHLKPHLHVRPQTLIALTEDDFAYALQQMNSYIDVTPEDLSELFECARDHALMEKKSAARGESGAVLYWRE